MLVLNDGDLFRGDASAADVVDYTIHGLDGSSLARLGEGQLGAAEATLVTASGVDTIAAVALVNTDSSARTVNLYLQPSGGTSRRVIPKDLSLGAGYSLLFDGQKFFVLNTDGAILTSGGASYTDTAARAAINDIFGSDGKADKDIDLDSHDLINVTRLNLESSHGAYISSGTLAINNYSNIQVYGEGSADDDLATISGLSTGDIAVLYPASGQEITIKHGTGNLVTQTGLDYIIPANGFVIAWKADGMGSNCRILCPVPVSPTFTFVSTGTIKEATGTNTTHMLNSDGSVNKPQQPAFFAHNSSADANVTGDGTAVTVDFDTEIFDVGGDFAADTFTAPVAGKYLLSGAVLLTSLAAGHTTAEVRLVTSNRTYAPVVVDGGATASSAGSLIIPFTIIADMDAADTAYVEAEVSGSTKTVGVFGHATIMYTYFQGALLL